MLYEVRLIYNTISGQLSKRLIHSSTPLESIDLTLPPPLNNGISTLLTINNRISTSPPAPLVGWHYHTFSANGHARTHYGGEFNILCKAQYLAKCGEMLIESQCGVCVLGLVIFVVCRMLFTCTYTGFILGTLALLGLTLGIHVEVVFGIL
jgi:hypothetical protein